MSEVEEDESPLSRAERSVFGPLAYSAAVFAMNAGYIVALLAAAYILYGLLSGGLNDFNTLAQADKARVLANIAIASRALTFGMGVAAVTTAYVLWGEEFVGYGIVIGALLVGLGIPQVYAMVGGDKAASMASSRALQSFPAGMIAPLVVGGILVVRDIVLRLVNGVKARPVKAEKMTFGKGAKAESKPVRTSLFAKCWEGPYCRDFVRPTCPIFISRKACWKEKRGCYCEEDIVSAAAAKVNGTVLSMAPDPLLNYANDPKPAASPSTPPPVKVAFDPLATGMQMQNIGSSGMGQIEIGIGGGLGGGTLGGGVASPPRKIQLSAAQKRERCRNCVIYNEHQREKYGILMPVTILASIGLCLLLSANLKTIIGASLTGIDTILSRISFNGSGGSAETMAKFAHPSTTVEWFLIAAITLMIVSKALQALEWAVFKVKI